jgi:hypothetical protein
VFANDIGFLRNPTFLQVSGVQVDEQRMVWSARRVVPLHVFMMEAAFR